MLVDETDNYMPLPLELSHRILRELALLRRDRTLSYLRPDAKAQVSVRYDQTHKPQSIDTIVISTQHDNFDTDQVMHQRIRKDLIDILMPRVWATLNPSQRHLYTQNIVYHINPTGKFVIGGPHGDTGLTGRKIIVDTYGGKGAHGGGAFSGKDPSKVDRSAAYAARHIAKNLVAAGIAKQVLIQLSYAIGVADPTSIHLNTYKSAQVKLTDEEIAKRIQSLFPLRPVDIVKRLKLQQPMYLETAAYGHMGRTCKRVEKTFYRQQDTKKMDVELFTWEKLDYIERIQQLFDKH